MRILVVLGVNSLGSGILTRGLRLKAKEDWAATEYIAGGDLLTNRLRIKCQKLIYYLLTGYWNTGERLHPLFVTNNYINHLRVYQYMYQFAHDREVLDVGCGVGYGTALLGRCASRAVGIDLSQTAVNEAYRLYPESEFFQMDAEDMRFPDNSFDVIISTENFEHLPNQAKHVAELARVVRPNGFCFVSTPNPELFVGLNNPFHTKENTYSELKDLFLRRFRQVEIIEPTTIPHTAEGRAARETRFAHGDHGILVTPELQVFGKTVKQTFLSNTHSFNCFVRDPIR